LPGYLAGVLPRYLPLGLVLKRKRNGASRSSLVRFYKAATNSITNEISSQAKHRLKFHIALAQLYLPLLHHQSE
jgi:hypothetical protein